MRLLNFTIIKLTICFIAGIIIAYTFKISVITTFYLTLGFLAVLFASLLMAKSQFIKTIWFGVLAYTIMFLVGILTTNFHNEKNISTHYIHHLPIEKDSLYNVTFRVRDALKPGNYYHRYIVDVLKINDLSVGGKSLLNIQNDSVKTALKIDDILITKSNFKDVNPPLNPNQFNYKTYLENQYIYKQLFINDQTFLKSQSQTHTLFGVANDIRAHINSKLKPYNFKPAQISIINALLLGQRQDIDEDVYNNYINAGAIHILAVSGLHVGIILLLLSMILEPIERIKNGKIIKTVLLVTLLWSFALIAGLSPSVTRAVTMFSIVAIAINLKRPTNIYNTLAISMFAILLFKPLFLFDVGFQLSYLAVFAIVAIDPYLYNLWRPKNWLLDKYWHTLTVTVSAQFGVIPISLFYFHQFPGLFFISNLVIIPLLGIILGFGILVIILAAINLLPVFLANIYGAIISLMNDFVAWVSNQEQFVLKDIAYNIWLVIASYLFIITLISFLKHKKSINLKLLLMAIVLFQTALIFTAFNKASNQFVIFHKSRFSLIGNTTNNETLVAHDFDSITNKNDRIIRDYKVANHIKTIKQDSLQNIYMLNDKKILVVDSLGVYNIKSFQPDYLLLRQSPKINLNRLIDSIKPKVIIADGSNYKSYVDNWERICEKKQLPFHQTSKKGAFIINY